MQRTEAWQILDCDRIVTVNPQGRFKADSAIALASSAAAGIGISWLPACVVYDQVTSGALLPYAP